MQCCAVVTERPYIPPCVSVWAGFVIETGACVCVRRKKSVSAALILTQKSSAGLKLNTCHGATEDSAGGRKQTNGCHASLRPAVSQTAGDNSMSNRPCLWTLRQPSLIFRWHDLVFSGRGKRLLYMVLRLYGYRWVAAVCEQTALFL